jgi:hypothetical protein
MYAPPQSFHCLPANDVQIVGMSEFPDSIGENTHVVVDGKMVEGVADGQHTRFVIQAISVLPTGLKH